MGESHGCQKQKLLPIIRSGNGKFFGLGDSNMPSHDRMEGRFAQILPRNWLSPNAVARETMLEVKGVNIAKPGTTVGSTLRADFRSVTSRRRQGGRLSQEVTPPPLTDVGYSSSRRRAEQ